MRVLFWTLILIYSVFRCLWFGIPDHIFHSEYRPTNSGDAHHKHRNSLPEFCQFLLKGLSEISFFFAFVIILYLWAVTFYSFWRTTDNRSLDDESRGQLESVSTNKMADGHSISRLFIGVSTLVVIVQCCIFVVFWYSTPYQILLISVCFYCVVSFVIATAYVIFGVNLVVSLRPLLSQQKMEFEHMPPEDDASSIDDIYQHSASSHGTDWRADSSHRHPESSQHTHSTYIASRHYKYGGESDNFRPSASSSPTNDWFIPSSSPPSVSAPRQYPHLMHTEDLSYPNSHRRNLSPFMTSEGSPSFTPHNNIISEEISLSPSSKSKESSNSSVIVRRDMSPFSGPSGDDEGLGAPLMDPAFHGDTSIPLENPIISEIQIITEKLVRLRLVTILCSVAFILRALFLLFEVSVVLPNLHKESDAFPTAWWLYVCLYYILCEISVTFIVVFLLRHPTHAEE